MESGPSAPETFYSFPVSERVKVNETEKNESVEVVRGETIAFPHPKLDDVVIEDAKALGIHFKMDLKNEQSYLTFSYWAIKEEILTKRNVARSYARCWNPLFDLAPVTNPAKVAISKMWELNSFFVKRLAQNKFDFREKGNYRPLANRKDKEKQCPGPNSVKEAPKLVGIRT